MTEGKIQIALLVAILLAILSQGPFDNTAVLRQIKNNTDKAAAGAGATAIEVENLRKGLGK